MNKRKRLEIYEVRPYFVTVVTHKKRQIFNEKEIRDLWIKEMRYCRKKLNFLLYGFCLLYNHFHLILTPEEKRTVSDIMHHINGVFANSYNKYTKNNGQVFQKRFWDHVIRNEHDLESKLSYIHENPLKHGLVKNIEDLECWEHSSYHNYYCDHKQIIDIDFPT